MSDVEDDESSGDEVVETKGQKQSMGLRATKFFLSKTAATKPGRKVIMSFVGEAGDRLLKCSKNMTARHQGTKRAKELRTNLLKIVLKVKVMYDHKQITLVGMRPLQHPLNSLLMALLRAMYRPKALPPVSEADIKELSRRAKGLRKDVVALVGPFMKADSRAKLEDLLDYYGGVDFLTILILDPTKEYGDDIEIMRSNLKDLMAAEIARSQTAIDKQGKAACVKEGCPKDALRDPVLGLYRYCLDHLSLEKEVVNPSNKSRAEPMDEKQDLRTFDMDDEDDVDEFGDPVKPVQVIGRGALSMGEGSEQARPRGSSHRRSSAGEIKPPPK